ncbi:12490_t:CDS:2, partial [Ambispora leptoticha]
AVEPHIVRSNSIEALSSNLTKNRLQLFATLVEKKPVNLTELAHLLQKDYALVRRDARILEGMGLIKLEKVANQAQNGHGSGIRFNEVRPIALYKRIVFDFPIQEEARIENGYIEETERLERQSQEYLKEIELAKFHEERGKINCECYSCEEQKIIRSEVINEQKKIITDYEAEQKKEMAVE